MPKKSISSFCWACGHYYSIKLGHICSKPKDYVANTIKKLKRPDEGKAIMVSRIYTNLFSECCQALPWKLEVYDSLGICSECKEHSSFGEIITEKEED